MARSILAASLLCCISAVGGVSLSVATLNRQRTVAASSGIANEAGRVMGHTVIEKASFKVISFVEPFFFIEAPHAQVDGLLPPQTSLGTLMAYVPTSPVNNEFFLYLPGSKANCSVYSQLLETIGSKMLSLCLPYDNRDFLGSLCLNNHTYNNTCFTEFRTAALEGDYLGVKHSNIEYRLVSALKYLANQEGAAWGSYLQTSSGRPAPLWSSMRVAGHSQGAGNAGMIGYKRNVARVFQIAGICDVATWPERMAPPITPAQSWFGLGHDTDHTCPMRGPRNILRHWVAEGMLEQGEQPLALQNLSQISPSFVGDAQAVVSFIPPPWNCSGVESTDCSHDSLAVDVWGPNGSPYGPIWLSLFGL